MDYFQLFMFKSHILSFKLIKNMKREPKKKSIAYISPGLLYVN